MSDIIDFGSAFRSAWAMFRTHAATFVSISFVFFVITIALDSVDGKGDAQTLSDLVTTLFSFFAAYIMTRLSIGAIRGDASLWKDVFSFHWGEFAWYVVASIIAFALYVAGFLALIIPGIILIVRLSLMNFALIDEDLAPIDAIKRSWELSRGHFWKLFVAGLIVIGLNIVGMLALGIGLIISTPLSFLFSAYIYDRFREASVPMVAESH